jgi:hypothetical protein
MNKIVSFFKLATPLKLLVLVAIIVVVTYFIQKPLPNVFLGFRLIAFVLFVYAITKFFKSR